MKKGKTVAPVEEPPHEEAAPEIPKSGFGKFEYIDQTLYVGEWKLMDDGTKVKHGQGKIVFPGVSNSSEKQVGNEEYDGQWFED